MASAQNVIQPLLDPVVLPDYSRDRNVSVADAPHPDYDPLGIDLGSFQVFPALTQTSQLNSNVFFNDFNKHTDGVALVQPSISVQSDWSHNLLQVYAADQIRRDVADTIFNKNTWFAQVHGRFDINDAFNVNAIVQVGHFTESPFSSVASGDLAILSEFNQVVATVKVVWTDGRLRMTAEYDHFSVQYAPLTYTTGAILNQAYRNNRVDKDMVQGEYSLSPSLALYSQVSVDHTRYPYTAEFDQPGRNSTGVAFVGGVSLDWSGVARGAFGLGFSHRAYGSGAFANPSGLSMQAKIEVFASTSTTLTGSAYRLLRDANTGQSVAYYDGRAELDADHALAQNVIVSTRLSYGTQQFLEDPRRRAFYQASLGGKIKFNRRFNLGATLGYNKSTVRGVNTGVPFGQFIGSMALQYTI